MPQLIPLNSAPNQTVTVLLGAQSTQVYIYQKNNFGLFCDVSVNNALIIGGVICQNLNRIVRDAYLGFIGDLVFNDTQGTADPVSTGLGSQFVLLYFTPAELATFISPITLAAYQLTAAEL
jgi:hypothetical protein